MRKVLSNSDEVFHFWANQVQSEGRAGNVSFQGPDLYSYAACIGRMYKVGDKWVAVLSSRSWSPTTSSHQSGAAQAASHREIVRVPQPHEMAYLQMDLVKREVAELMGKSKRARTNKDWYLSIAVKKAEDFNRYAEICDETCRIDIDNLDEVMAQVEAARVERAKREREARRQRDLTNADLIQEWLDGKRYYCPRTADCLLRVYAEVIQTSWGANIPVDDGKRLWPIVLRVMQGDRDYEVGMKVGYYQLTKIRRNGSIVVGCHDIAFSQLERIAKQLNLIGQPAELTA